MQSSWRQHGAPVTVGKSPSHPLFLGAFMLVSSIWLQFIWLAVGSTVKTRDLVKLNDNSIPSAPTRSRSAQRTCEYRKTASGSIEM
jgi:hypothetical protein